MAQQVASADDSDIVATGLPPEAGQNAVVSNGALVASWCGAWMRALARRSPTVIEALSPDSASA